MAGVSTVLHVVYDIKDIGDRKTLSAPAACIAPVLPAPLPVLPVRGAFWKRRYGGQRATAAAPRTSTQTTHASWLFFEEALRRYGYRGRGAFLKRRGCGREVVPYAATTGSSGASTSSSGGSRSTVAAVVREVAQVVRRANLNE